MDNCASCFEKAKEALLLMGYEEVEVGKGLRAAYKRLLQQHEDISADMLIAEAVSAIDG